MAQAPLRVLISGAGIAGGTLGALLGRAGHRVVVVERDQGTRSSGNPVDVRGAAFGVVESLGILPRLEEAATQVRQAVFVDDGGRRVARMPTRRSDRELEIARTDLCAAVLEAAWGAAELRFDDSVVRIQRDASGADVTFDRGGEQRFDLVVGADGVHSRVRRLAFGPDDAVVSRLGMVVATAPLPGLEVPSDSVLLRSAPGAVVALHPGAGRPGVGFFLRSGEDVDVHDRAATDMLLSRAFEPLGWRVPALLAAYRSAPDAWCDAVCRVRTRRWSQGPVVLVGDAASCVTLFGEGSSAAVTGAAALAEALAAAPDIRSALERYERRHRPVVRRGQRGAWVGSHVLVPATAAGIAARNALLRAFVRSRSPGRR